jgi:hypothetical protein
MKRYLDGSKRAELDDVFCVLYDGLIVNFDTTLSIARFLFSQTEIKKGESVIEKLKRFRNRNNEAFIYLLVKTKSGFITQSLKLIKSTLA